MRRDTFSITLPPGKGAEVKSHLKAGDGLVFRWTATGEVAADMHGEQPDTRSASSLAALTHAGATGQERCARHLLRWPCR